MSSSFLMRRTAKVISQGLWFRAQKM